MHRVNDFRGSSMAAAVSSSTSPDSSSGGASSGAATRYPIPNPRLVMALRAACVILLVFFLLQLPIRIPEYLRNCGCPQNIVEVWESLGIASFVRVLFTLSAAVQIVAGAGLGALLMLRRSNDRVAVMFAFFF